MRCFSDRSERRTRIWGFSARAAIAFVTLTLGCADGNSSTEEWSPLEPSEIEHGECSIGSDGRESCDCDPGYVGERCEDCDTGYIAQGDDCEREDDPPCRTGYAGADCTDCAPRYHREGGSCVPDQQCSRGACPRLSNCDDSTGTVVCECYEGYEGDDCDRCSAGYHDDRGSCAPNQECTPDSCSGRGICDDGDGVIACACDPGFEGTRCSRCAVGFHEIGDGCSALPTCGLDTCSNHGVCSETALGVSCACDDAYSGEKCDECADDYVLVNGACMPREPDEMCEDDTCSGHGECDDSSGTARCSCDAGYAGVACQQCSPGRVEHWDGRCQLSRCGDGVRDPDRDEGCDDDNTVTEQCTYTESQTPCTVCRSDCTLGAGIPNYCGDGNLDSVETCDDGANNGVYRPGATLGYCNADCSGYGPYCGDGLVDDDNEECDLGIDPMTGNSDSVPDRCRTNCRSPSCGDGVVDDGEACDDGGAADGCPPDCQEEEPEACPYTLTHSVDPTTIVSDLSVSCTDGTFHNDIGYLRIFDLDELGITSFDVTQVRFGVQTSTVGGMSQPVVVRIYSSTTDPPTVASLTLLEDETVNLGSLTDSFVTAPIEATLAGAGAFLAAEVFTPDGAGAENLLLIGTNSAGETDDSFVLAPDCNIDDYVTMAAIGLATRHILIHVDGNATGSVCDED